MRAALTALADELKRLKASGVSSVVVSDEGLAALRRVVQARARSVVAAVATEAPAVGTSPSGAERPVPPAVAAAEPMKSRVSVPASAPKPAPRSAPRLPAPPVVTLPAGDKAARWAALREQVLQNPVCREQVRPGKQLVVGVGSLDAKIMFVGEAPGAEEEIAGEPFVGPAGQLLTRMIGGMGLKREEVYIANIMAWRPQTPTAPGVEQTGNHPPTSEELAFCLPFLRAQIEIVQPEILVALGSTAAQGLLGPDSFKTLAEIRGRWKQFAEKPVMVTYHPSYILRNGSQRSKRMIWEDLLQVMERARLPISDKQRGYFLDK